MIVQTIKTNCNTVFSESIYAQLMDSTNFTEELIRIRNSFKKESDRALIILACSAIDVLLKRIIEKKFIAVSHKKEKLLGKTQPLSSFHSKIEIAYRIGVISENLKRDLNILRDMRNIYAHNLDDTTLEDKEMVDRINTIMINCPKVEHNSKNGNRNPSNRRRIEIFIGTVLVSLNNTLKQIEKINNTSKELFLYDEIK